MIKIAIVDDEKIHRENISIIIDEYFQKGTYQCVDFSNGNDMLNSEVSKYDIVFLDIEMPEIDGISLAQKITAINNKALLFYVSSYVSLVTRAINNNAFTFIPKPIKKEDLFLELDRALTALNKADKSITIKSYNTQSIIKINEITYIEVQGKECKLHLNNNTDITTNERLHAILDELSDGNFVQCHKSYIVNLNYVCELNNKSQIKLNICDDIIPVGRNYVANFKEQLNLFIGGLKV